MCCLRTFHLYVQYQHLCDFVTDADLELHYVIQLQIRSLRKPIFECLV